MQTLVGVWQTQATICFVQQLAQYICKRFKWEWGVFNQLGAETSENDVCSGFRY
ncbi:hypothetical protein F442_22108 [Phytophthora nicotianae P10297]|uniref:Uncharacterized protein n=2 Tax=Phytophthora nicotianae TaxID=4792 RepID=W2Y0G9_PHYNI|nr:hypothetical protein F442_22108 [Phytophthora nicotianae P10297]